MQSLKVRGPFGSLDLQTLLVLGPLQKLLLPLTFRSNVPFLDNSITVEWLFLWFVVQCKLKSRQKRKIELAKMQIISAVHVLF